MAHARNRRSVPDEEHPEWTPAEMANARPAGEVFPPAVFVDGPKRRGRPPLERPKRLLSLRIDPDVIDAYRATGAGWQARMTLTLAEHAPLRRSSRPAKRTKRQSARR